MSKSVKALPQTPSIDKNIFLFICGLHRSGTSIFHRLLREHDNICGFYDTGVAEDEGQHLQSVFKAAHEYGGPGKFAFDTRAHLTENDGLITADNRALLLREWGAHYNLEQRVLLEKSPPNLIRSRFFQAMFPGARFVFIVRHPAAVALATQKWAGTTLTELLLHWHVAHSIMLADIRHLQNYSVIRYEDFVASPKNYLDAVCDMCDIGHFSPAEQVMNHNAKYFQQWQQMVDRDIELFETLLLHDQSPMKQFGYSFREPFVVETDHPLT